MMKYLMFILALATASIFEDSSHESVESNTASESSSLGMEDKASYDITEIALSAETEGE